MNSNSSHWVVLSAGELAWLLLFLVLAGVNEERKPTTAPRLSSTNPGSLPDRSEATNRVIRQQNDLVAATNDLLQKLLGERTAAVAKEKSKASEAQHALGKAQDQLAQVETRLAKAEGSAFGYSNAFSRAESDLKQARRDGEKRDRETAGAKAQLAAAKEAAQAVTEELENLQASVEREKSRNPEPESSRITPPPSMADREELLIRSELLGLKGRLESVTFVVDTSFSMNRGGRWDTATQVIGAWLDYLPIERCRLIFYNDGVSLYPKGNGYYEINGKGASVNRAYIRKLLYDQKPHGGTDTLSALRLAFADRTSDTVILFSDGEPNVGGSPKELARKIEELCRQQSGVVVNTVGLGDYFEPNLAGLLLRIAAITGGTFIGR